MRRIAGIRQVLTSAMVVLFGRHGEISREAREQGRSRQSLYRESAQVVAAVEGTEGQARIEELERQVAQQATEIEALRRRLTEAVEITEDKQAEFACTGQAEGVSLPVVRRLLGVFLGKKVPSVATLGRQTAEAGKKSGELLNVLDEAARGKVCEAAGDEIFLDASRC
jgi:hypothetical protein